MKNKVQKKGKAVLASESVSSSYNKSQKSCLRRSNAKEDLLDSAADTALSTGLADVRPSLDDNAHNCLAR